MSEARPVTPAAIMARPHIKEVVDLGEAAPVVMITPLRFLKPVLRFVEEGEHMEFRWGFKS